MNHQFSPTTHPYFQNQPFSSNNSNIKWERFCNVFCINLLIKKTFRYALTVQQQPQKARLCSFKDKGTIKFL
jgi:hypothetical protein